MAKKVTQPRGFFALTSPTGKVGIFHQLGSIRPGAICVQNCIAEKYSESEVEFGVGLRNQPVKGSKNVHLIFQMGKTVSYFKTVDGVYRVEKITTQDPRYMTSAIVREYSTFFGGAVVRSVKSDEHWAPKIYAAHINAIKALDAVLVAHGIIPAPVVSATNFAYAAKRKKKK